MSGVTNPPPGTSPGTSPKPRGPRHARPLRLQTPARLKPHLHRLPLLGIVPSFVLASYSLTQPWAKARIVMLWGISRSPEAVTLVIAALGGMVAASVAVALRGDRLRIAGWVHMVMGIVMCVVACLAFRFISHSGLKFLSIPIASVKPGPGLLQFVVAALMVSLLGVIELIVAARRRAAGRPG
jgi:hypothetical protein